MKLYTGGAGVIVYNENRSKILLGNRTDGQGWCLCGGKKELGETPVETAIRESEEEFGVKISKNDIIFNGTIYAKIVSHGETINVISDIFSTDVFEGEITPQLEEISEIRWCGFEDILELDKIFNTTLVSLNKFVIPNW